MGHGKEMESQNKDTVENWYEFNKILLRVFLIWLCFTLAGCMIIPWNYYYYRTNEFIKGRGIVVENKFILNLTNGSKSIFPYRNRQNLYFSIYDSDVSDIYIEKIEIRTINGEKIYEKFIGEKLSDLQKKGETDIFNGKDLGARQNGEILLKLVYYIKNERKIEIVKPERVKDENSFIIYNSLIGFKNVEKFI